MFSPVIVQMVDKIYMPCVLSDATFRNKTDIWQTGLFVLPHCRLVWYKVVCIALGLDAGESFWEDLWCSYDRDSSTCVSNMCVFRLVEYYND